MNILLLFFALPIAIIILAVVSEKILRCPILTAATFFAIFLIVAFAVFDASFLIFVIVYTILAFIAALIAEFFFRRCNRDIRRIAEQLARIQNDNDNNHNNNCCCNHSNDVATVNVTNNTTGGRTTWCCHRR